MKKVVFCGAVLFLAIAALAFAGRAEIDATLDSYEALVVEAENLAGLHLVDMDDFAALDERGTEFDSAAAAVMNDRDWKVEDARRATELRNRFNQAIGIMILKLLQY